MKNNIKQQARQNKIKVSNAKNQTMRSLFIVSSLFVLLLAGDVLSLRLPKFHDPVLGDLVVSGKKFPFLTSSVHPELAYIYPNDEQMAEIRAAVRSQVNRHKRQLGEDDGDEINLPDPDAAFSWFEKFQKFLGKFLKFEFSYEETINSTIVDPGRLPFDKIDQDAYFKAFVIPKDQFKPYLEEEFNPRMRKTQKEEKPWLPAEKLIQEMKECLYFRYGTASDEDFEYDKNIGGVMVYYKITCMRVKDNYYVGLSTYDNNFVLHDIEHVELKTSSWSFMGFGKTKTKERRWFEKRYVTLDDLKLLLDFIMSDFAERIRIEYRQYLNSATIAPE